MSSIADQKIPLAQALAKKNLNWFFQTACILSGIFPRIYVIFYTVLTLTTVIKTERKQISQFFSSLQCPKKQLVNRSETGRRKRPHEQLEPFPSKTTKYFDNVEIKKFLHRAKHHVATLKLYKSEPVFYSKLLNNVLFFFCKMYLLLIKKKKK